MIEIKHLTKRYQSNKEDTLKDISFSFPETGLYYIIGKSGSGKSTLLSLIGGMDNEYSGSLKVKGKELKELNEDEISEYRFEMVSYSFQDFKTDEKEKVYDILFQTLAITDLRKSEIDRRIEEKLRLVGLADKKKARFSSLSGGEKKRISLARALLKDAPILLVDEPLSSLNQRMRNEISSFLFQESKRRLVLVITHETDELKQEANVLKLIDGRLACEMIYPASQTKSMSSRYLRKPYDGIRFILSLLRGIKNKSEFLMITLASLALAFFTISFSFLLSDGVKSSLSDSLSQYMNTNSMVVSCKDSGYISESMENADYSFLLHMKNKYSDKVIQASGFYEEDIDLILDEGQSISVLLENRSLRLISFRVSSFLEPIYPQELEENQIIYGKKELSDTEVILGLKEDEAMSLYALLYSRICPNLDASTLEKMGKDILRMNLALRIQANVNQWKYHLDHSLTICGIYLSETSRILHTNPGFSENFLENVMYFDEYIEGETIPEEKPWGLHKKFGLIIRPNETGSFLSDFLKEENADPYVLYPMKQKNHYRKEDSFTHNRFLVYTDCMTKVSISDMESFKRDTEGILSARYSTPIYTYTGSGYIRGFSKPFFFSKYKEKLNRIQDNNLYSDENLGQFQSSAFELPDGVIKADLLSSADKGGLRFITMEENTNSLVQGKEPQSSKEIAISSGFARSMFDNPKRGIGETLHVLTLEKTEAFQDKFINSFQGGELTICGVYDNEDIAFYQDGLFPLSYGIEHLNLSYSDLRINQAILDVDLSIHDIDYYKSRIAQFGDYQSSFPMASMLEEINLTMSRLSLLFLVFSILSMAMASLLLGLSLFLILERDRKNIGVMLTLGYRKKEIHMFYFGFSLLLTLIGYAMSFFITLLSEKVISRTLEDTFNIYVSSVHPYLISLSVGLLISLFLSLLLYLKIKKMTPLEAFRNKK